MKTISFWFLFCILETEFSHSAKSPKQVCPSGFTFLPENKRCYKIVYENVDWKSAAKTCKKLRAGSHLVAIKTPDNNEAIKTFLFEHPPTDDKTCRGSSGHMYWTSGRKSSKENCYTPFVWKVDKKKGQQISFDGWGPDQPTCMEGVASCLVISQRKDFRWINVLCDTKTCPLCEFNPAH